ncbi:uncharacterized protein CEXT_761671 [Caerostris extrusa]|uniref:Endonuclease/exonuclease/phosphatase domain-containing protein n=1 Tax=Caerostris extrusa TaxID=172846 RepID=A0AAV4UHY0_CAEEX|nr:uncharacterized protein CEXT_761671 [Caerostris extrusa]
MEMPASKRGSFEGSNLELPTIESGNFDIYLIQEPYLINGQVAGLPLGWRTVLEENGVLIAVSNPQLVLLTRWISRYIVTVEVSDAEQSDCCVGLLPPSRPKDRAVRELDMVLDQIPCTRMLVGGDVNTKETLCGDRTSNAIGIKCKNKAQLDEFVQEFTQAIQTACTSRKTANTQEHRRVPWWDDELTILRKQVRHDRRRFQRSRNPNERITRRETFCKSRAIYRHKLLEKKNRSWIRFCERVSRINIWQLPYKLELTSYRNLW